MNESQTDSRCIEMQKKEAKLIKTLIIGDARRSEIIGLDRKWTRLGTQNGTTLSRQYKMAYLQSDWDGR